MNRKKAAAGFLAALLAVSLTACNKPATPPASSAAATTEATAPSTTMATTESTTTTTETAAATTTKKKTTTKKPKPKTTAPRKTAAPTKVTLPTNAPTGSPTPPPTTPPTAAIVPSAEAKEFLARYNGSIDKYAQLNYYHVENATYYAITSGGEKMDILDTNAVMYKQGSGSNRILNYSITGSVFGSRLPVTAAYMDGDKLYTNIDGEVTVEPFDQELFDSNFDMVLSEDIQESDILNIKKNGDSYVFTMRPSEEDMAELEQTLGCQCQNLVANVTASFTSDGYLLEMDESVTGDVGMEQEEGVMSWFSLDMRLTLRFNKPGNPLTVPKPDWVATAANNP